jgi:hypothetical protein
VRKVALAGDVRQGREHIRAVAEAGADSIHVFPLGGRRMQTIEAFSRCFAEVTQGAVR